MVQREVIRKIRRFVAALKKQKIKVSKAVLYGSWVTGKTHEYSDIDVAIISPSFGKDRTEEGMLLFEIAVKIDPLIEPVPISSKSYKNEPGCP